MVNKNFSGLDYLVFVLLLVSSSLIGVYFAWKSRKSANNDEFFTGNRKLSLFPVTLSLVASFMSTNTILGVPAEVFQIGTQIIVQVFTVTTAILLAIHIFMPVYYRIGFTSVHQYLFERFQSSAVRTAGTVAFLLATLPYMAVVLYGPSLALSSVTPLSIEVSILLVGLICTFYTAIGGIKAVIWTDVLQCILMFLGVTMVVIQGAIEVGGLSNAWRIADAGGRIKLANFAFDLYRSDTVWNVIFGTVTIWSATYCVTQTQVQRYCSMESKEQARRTLYYNIPGLIIFTILSVLCGVVIFAKYHDCDPIRLKEISRHDQLMPYFVMDTMSHLPGLPGLFVACAFSGSLSTLSSGFNALAAVTWEDLLKGRIEIKSDSKAIWVTRGTSCMYGLIAIAFAFVVGRLGTVLQASIAVVGSMMGPMLALFLMGVLCPFVTSKGAICGHICGIIFSLWLTIGTLVYPRPKIAMSTSLDGCFAAILNSTEWRSYKHNFVESASTPEGMMKFYHVSYLLTPLIGFLTTLVIGCVASVFLGEQKKVNARLLSKAHRYVCPLSENVVEERHPDVVLNYMAPISTSNGTKVGPPSN